MKRIAETLLVSAMLSLTVAWSAGAWAENRVPRLGILAIARGNLESYANALRPHGLIPDKNVTLEIRDAGGDPRGLAEPASQLVQMKVDVIFAVGPPAVRAAAAATNTIPIVAHDLETDPVAAGYAQSYSRPGGNITGLFLDSPDLAGKWIELLRSIVPKLSRIVVLWDTTSGPIPLQAVRDVAPAFGIELQILEIHTPAEIDNVASRFRGRPQALIILPSPMMFYESARLAKLARKQNLPATSMFVSFAEAGGMLAYGPDLPATFDPCAELVAKILAGAKPGDLPIQRPTKFEFVFNQKAARNLRLKVPPGVLIRADRVIQ